MRPLKESLLDYLTNFTGERPELTPKRAAKLPLFLRTRYEFYTVQLFGRSFLLALASHKHTPVSPGEYAAEAESIFGLLGEPVVLVLPALPSHARNRMVQKSTPFIVPGSQLFLPTAVINLRERQPRPRAVTGKKLTPAAQCLVLYQLVREPFNQFLGEHPAASSLGEVASQIGYSPIMLTKVKAELVSAGLCEEVRQGRATLLRFLFEDEALWEHALPWLSSPQRARRWVRWELPPQPALLAGLSALARRSIIHDDPLPTYALWHKSYAYLRKDGFLSERHEREGANACVELWNYDPRTLGDQETVDPLSLYLSLRDTVDERIEKFLPALIEEMSW